MNSISTASSLKPHLTFHHQNPPKTSSSSSAILVVCGLRREARKPLWRSRVLTTEAIQVVQSLKFAKASPSKLEEVLRGKLSRLLKSDLLDTLTELQRQDELDLALKVFKLVKQEVWYKPELSLYCSMIRLLGQHKLIEMVEELFWELKKEGLEPDTGTLTEIIGAYIQVDRIEKAMEIYGLLKESGLTPHRLTFTILIRNLEKAGEEELASSVRKDCYEYLEYPEKFLEQLEAHSNEKRRVISVV